MQANASKSAVVLILGLLVLASFPKTYATLFDSLRRRNVGGNSLPGTSGHGQARPGSLVQRVESTSRVARVPLGLSSRDCGGIAGCALCRASIGSGGGIICIAYKGGYALQHDAASGETWLRRLSRRLSGGKGAPNDDD